MQQYINIWNNQAGIVVELWLVNRVFLFMTIIRQSKWLNVRI